MTKVKCLICGKEFDWLPPHLRIHNITTKEYYNRFPDAKIMADNLSRTGENNPAYGKPAWNKGLTKETDKRVEKYSGSRPGSRPDLKEKQTGKTFEEIWGIEKATEIKKNISETAKGKYASGETISERKGKTKENDTGCKRTSEKLKGKPKSEEHKKKLRGKRGPNEKLKGRIMSEETRRKMSKAKDKHAKRKVNCKYCNKEFVAYRSVIESGVGIFCSIKCKGKYQTELNKANILKTKCSYCGKEITITPSRMKARTNLFCSVKCNAKWKSENLTKEKSYLWRGGISFKPYCEKFNNNLKERVRTFFGRCCYLCGKNEMENGKKLDVHHVNYQKMACCSEEIRPLFVPLCTSCHGKTHGNREYWKDFFTTSLEYLTDGKCFYTKDETKERIHNINIGGGSPARI